MTTLTRKTEIRHLPSAEVFKIAQQLDSSQNWKKLMRIIPKKLEEDADILVFGGKYNAEHIKIIENNKGSRLAAEVLIDEWGTSGRIRPNLAHLLQLLVKAELFRAAEYVACDLLNEPLPKRPDKGPAAKIDITLPPDEEIEAIGGILSNMEYPNSSNLNNDRSQMDNNRDFYDKWTPNDQQKIRLDESRNGISENLIEFSVSSVSVTQDSNFSLHSDIVGNDGIVLVGGEDGPSNASRNIPSSIDTLSTDIPDTVTSNSENNTEIPNTEINDVLPDVSLLRVHRADPPEDSSDNLPHFSLLMPRAPPANETKSENTDVNLSSDSETFQSTSEIISDSIPNIPNLPMLQGK
ncbi:protein Tube [Phlebotomus papatasi]|uniref:protein Tube n=1 Tax=Phlebotomus papatasi TaxID=29031 RepID=UPI00248427D5|nr:protein Tube [Phlebotomus papatasi]